MSKRTIYRVAIIITLLLLAAGLFFLPGAMAPAAIVLAGGLFMLWKWFVRSPKPDTELPCAAVSCCHYLDHGTDKPQSGKNEGSG